MSVARAERILRRRIALITNARAEALRVEIFGRLERSRAGSGRLYPGARNRSSAPGESPARQTGRLMESIAITKRATPDDPVATVGPRPEAFDRGDPYPVFLEFGTRVMAPRPYLRPSIEAFRRKFGS